MLLIFKQYLCLPDNGWQIVVWDLRAAETHEANADVSTTIDSGDTEEHGYYDSYDGYSAWFSDYGHTDLEVADQ